MNTQKTIRRFLGLLCLSGVCAMAAGNPAPSKGTDNVKTATATLTQIQETRRVDLVSQKDGKTFDFNSPRLELSFDITPPDNRRIATIDQPTTIRSLDSTGNDLTAVQTDFTGRKEYVRLVKAWNKPPTQFTLKLAPTARAATSFSLSTELFVWAYLQTKELLFTPGTDGATLDAALFGGEEVFAQLKQTSGGLYLTITPGTIKNHIEEVTLTDGKNKLENTGSMWNKEAINYMFNGTVKSSLRAKIKVRVGLQRYLCNINLKDKMLP